MIYSIEFLYMIKNLKKLLKKLGEALYKIFHWFGSGAKRSGAKRSKVERSEAERCGASERSERCERTNVASDRVTLSKRDCLV